MSYGLNVEMHKQVSGGVCAARKRAPRTARRPPRPVNIYLKHRQRRGQYESRANNGRVVLPPPLPLWPPAPAPAPPPLPTSRAAAPLQRACP